MRITGLLALTLLGTATAALAAPPEGWHRSLKDGSVAARKSGKPLLVVTSWAEKV